MIIVKCLVAVLKLNLSGSEFFHGTGYEARNAEHYGPKVFEEYLCA